MFLANFIYPRGYLYFSGENMWKHCLHRILSGNHFYRKRDGVQAEHFDAEHSHDKFESHGTKNAGALPDKVHFFCVAGLKKHFLPSQRQEVFGRLG